jgi:hypothetical protein
MIRICAEYKELTLYFNFSQLRLECNAKRGDQHGYIAAIPTETI